MSVIDVAELIAGYDHSEHVAKADAYFENAAANPYYWRKPLYNGLEAAALLHNFSQILHDLDLYPGARILDFGAGSCWSSRWFAYMGCSVIAVDVSRNALKLGEEIAARDPIRGDLDLTFLPYDGERIALEDASIDRIVCLDCFHHVPDQRATLQEFFRLLRPGGLIGFSEPGPEHALTDQSQYEMKNYGVIENNIDLGAITDFAQGLGFSDPMVSYASQPRLMLLVDFERTISEDVDAATAKGIIDADAPHHANARCFYLAKPGGLRVAMDSRSTAGLSYGATVRLERANDRLSGEAVIANTGAASWLPASVGRGGVNIGVHLYASDGTLIDLDFARIALGGNGVVPGERVTVIVDLPIPQDGGNLIFDLVAEGVTWFEGVGNRPIVVRVPT